MEIHKLRYKVLIIEDDEDDALIVRDILDTISGSESDIVYSIEHAERLQTGLERLANETFDIILLDLNLPDSVGLNTLERLLDKVSEVPVIVLTGLNDESIGIKAVNIGAQDYLVKGVIHGRLLPQSIRYAIERHHLILERKRVDEALRISAQQWQTTFDAMNDAVFLMDTERRIIRANNAMSNFLGKPNSEIVGKACYELVHGMSTLPEECPLFRMHKTHLRESQIMTLNDRWFNVNVDPLLDEMGNITGAVHIMYDITERKLLEEIQNISYKFLKLANQHTEIAPLLNEFVKEIHEFTACEAIGIRLLDDNGNIPYMAYEGFSPEFFESESQLSIHSDHCMCINVIKGETDPKLPFFTEGGSFYVNSTTKFLATVSEKDKEHIRNRCNRAGYESVALIPINISDHIIGLIQVADHQENKIPLKRLNMLERLANELGTAIHRVKMEEFIHNSEKQYRIINENMRDTVWLMDMQMRTTWISPSVEKLRGFTLQELTEMPLDKHLTSKSLENAITLISEYITPENLADKNRDIAIAGDLEFYKKDGTTFWGDVIISLLRDNEGNPSMFLCVGRDINDRKQNEEILKERDEMLIQQHNTLRQLIDNLPDQIFIKDTESRFVIANRDALRGLGISSPDGIIGKSDFDFLSSEEAQQHYEEEQEIMKTGIGFVNNEYSFLDSSGAKRWTSSTKVPLQDADGKIIGLVGSNRNITKVRQAEEEIHKVEKIYRNAIEATGAVPYIANFDTRKYEFMGENIKLLTGYSAEEFTLQTWGSILMETENPSGKYTGLTRNEAIDKAIDESKSNAEGTAKFWLDFHIRTRSGEEKWLFDSSMQTRDDQGRIVRSLGIVHDITERKQMEKSLIESEKKYRELVENLNDIIFNLDTKGCITYIGPSVNQIFGYTVDEVIGKQFSQFVPIQDLPGLMPEFEQTMKGKLEPYEFQIVDKDGKIHYVRTSSRPILENGEIMGLTGLLADITIQRQLEEQFRQAQKMEAIGLLAGGIAHDFNNLLQVIIGYSEFMQLKLDDKNPMRYFIEEIRKAGEHAATLTRQLLAFSHKQMLQQQVLSINDLIKDTSNMLKRLIGEDIELIVSLAPELMPLKADPGQIEQVIMNLVINARDAMTMGGKLTIKTESITIDSDQSSLMPESQPGDYVCLSISDTGVGMSKDVISHILEPFFTTKGSIGTGLGLAVVYGVVKQHDGWINIYSEPDKGSVFKIYLPVFSRNLETKDKREPKLIDFKGNGERILLVEDEQQVREFVVKLVQEVGYKVFVAKSATEAIEIFAEEDGNFDLIFTDVVLADENGVQLVEKFLIINPNLSILLTSGYTDQKSQWNNIKDKGFRFIQKPYMVADLLKALKEAIKEYHV